MSKALTTTIISLSLLIYSLMLSSCSNAAGMSGRQAFVIYDGKGSVTTYSEMLDDISGYDVVLFGELHNDPISHWLELSIAQDLYEICGEGLTIGAEMWERDNQLVLDEFLKDSLIDLGTYIENSRMWTNFATDYLPVLQFADEKDIPFVATNVPRRYARMVSDRGLTVLDSLDQEAYNYLPPLPIEMDFDEKNYVYISEIFKNMSGMPSRKSDVRNLVEAQALKDACMAYFISKNMTDGGAFFHFHGELHSAYRSAIAFYLKKYAPGTRIATISVMEAEDPGRAKPEKGRADYIIAVPQTMTKTYAE